MADQENGSNSVFNGMPKWVRIAAFLGFPAFFAVVLLTFVLKQSSGQMQEILTVQLEARANVASITAIVTDTRNDVHVFMDEQKADRDVMKQILQEMCAQGAIMSGRPLGKCFPPKPVVPKDPEWKK